MLRLSARQGMSKHQKRTETRHLCTANHELVTFVFDEPVHFSRWYFGKIRRVEAEKLLLTPINEHGAFMIRDSESRQNDFSLSGKHKGFSLKSIWRGFSGGHCTRIYKGSACRLGFKLKN